MPNIRKRTEITSQGTSGSKSYGFSTMNDKVEAKFEIIV